MGKEEFKLSLFADMILCVENPKDSNKNCFNEFIKVTGYKSNLQKSAFNSWGV